MQLCHFAELQVEMVTINTTDKTFQTKAVEDAKATYRDNLYP